MNAGSASEANGFSHFAPPFDLVEHMRLVNAIES